MSQTHPYNPPIILEPDPQRRQNRIPGWYRFYIGDIEATIASDGRLRPDPPEAQFPQVGKETLHAILRRQHLPTDGLIMEQNCLVLRVDGRLVLFDVGIGQDRTIGSDETGRLLDNLAAASIAAGDISAVVLTHAHCDHCWGLVDESGLPNFPNAELFLSQAEFDFWTDETKISQSETMSLFIKGARNSLLPYRDRIRFVSDGDEFLPSVTAIASAGHSIGHMSYLIASGTERALILGDVAHSSALLFENPDWGFLFDYDDKQAVTTRRRLFERAVVEDLILIGYHFQFPGVGHIRRERDAFDYIPAPILHR